MYYKPGIKEPRFNLMYDKFKFYQRQKFRLDLSLEKWRYFFLLWAVFFFLFFSLPKDFFLFFIFPLRVISVKSFHVGILSST